MLVSYFKIAWRNILKNKGYSHINGIGLTIGIVVTVLIGVWVFDELSFNKNHVNHNRIAEVHQHRIVNNEIQTSAAPRPLAFELHNDYKNDLKHVVRMWWL